MRVLHLLSSDRYSGAENVVCQIVHMFQNDNEYEMFYCSPDGPIREALKERDVAFVPLKATSLFEFRRVIRETKPDIVHAHDMKACFLAALTCGKIPLISHIHVNNFKADKVSLKVLLYRFAAYKAKHIFWVSKSSFEGYLYHEEFRNKSTILYNIIDVEQLRKRAEEAENNEKYDIVYLGRLSYQKNPQRLIEVIEKVVKVLPSLKVAIIGSGDLDEEVSHLINSKGLEKKIDMKGFMSNPYGILSNAKVMLMTSRYEGTPMSALEAMALGVPIVSTPTDGMNELIINGENGFLSADDERLCENICSIISDAQLQYGMSEAQKRRSVEVNDTKAYAKCLKEKYH